MSEPGDMSKLRMAPRESPEDLARRFERERRIVVAAREEELAAGTGTARVGSVPYLNSVPLTRGLEEHVAFHPPSELARRLAANELDAALVSVVEVLFNDRYDVLDGIAVASLGEVKSVFLAHRKPVEAIDRVYCDPASLTSVTLLRVLLAERGLAPRFEPLPSYAAAADLDAVLLIGNPAIDFLFAQPGHEILDLGAAWYEATQLPFVFAVWALRRGAYDDDLLRRLREARDFGLDTLDPIINDRPEYTREFRKDYLGWHIHYHLGDDEKRGLAKFMEWIEKHGFGPVYPPRFVS